MKPNWEVASIGNLTISYRPSQKHAGYTEYKVVYKMDDGSKFTKRGGHAPDFDLDKEMANAQRSVLFKKSAKAMAKSDALEALLDDYSPEAALVWYEHWEAMFNEIVNEVDLTDEDQIKRFTKAAKHFAKKVREVTPYAKNKSKLKELDKAIQDYDESDDWNAILTDDLREIDDHPWGPGKKKPKQLPQEEGPHRTIATVVARHDISGSGGINEENGRSQFVVDLLRVKKGAVGILKQPFWNKQFIVTTNQVSAFRATYPNAPLVKNPVNVSGKLAYDSLAEAKADWQISEKDAAEFESLRKITEVQDLVIDKLLKTYGKDAAEFVDVGTEFDGDTLELNFYGNLLSKRKAADIEGNLSKWLRNVGNFSYRVHSPYGRRFSNEDDDKAGFEVSISGLKKLLTAKSATAANGDSDVSHTFKPSQIGVAASGVLYTFKPSPFGGEGDFKYIEVYSDSKLLGEISFHKKDHWIGVVPAYEKPEAVQKWVDKNEPDVENFFTQLASYLKVEKIKPNPHAKAAISDDAVQVMLDVYFNETGSSDDVQFFNGLMRQIVNKHSFIEDYEQEWVDTEEGVAYFAYYFYFKDEPKPAELSKLAVDIKDAVKQHHKKFPKSEADVGALEVLSEDEVEAAASDPLIEKAMEVQESVVSWLSKVYGKRVEFANSDFDGDMLTLDFDGDILEETDLEKDLNKWLRNKNGDDLTYRVLKRGEMSKHFFYDSDFRVLVSGFKKLNLRTTAAAGPGDAGSREKKLKTIEEKFRPAYEALEKLNKDISMDIVWDLEIEMQTSYRNTGFHEIKVYVDDKEKWHFSFDPYLEHTHYADEEFGFLLDLEEGGKGVESLLKIVPKLKSIVFGQKPEISSEAKKLEKKYPRIVKESKQSDYDSSGNWDTVVDAKNPRKVLETLAVYLVLSDALGDYDWVKVERNLNTFKKYSSDILADYDSGKLKTKLEPYLKKTTKADLDPYALYNIDKPENKFYGLAAAATVDMALLDKLDALLAPKGKIDDKQFAKLFEKYAETLSYSVEPIDEDEHQPWLDSTLKHRVFDYWGTSRPKRYKNAEAWRGKNDLAWVLADYATQDPDFKRMLLEDDLGEVSPKAVLHTNLSQYSDKKFADILDRVSGKLSFVDGFELADTTRNLAYTIYFKDAPEPAQLAKVVDSIEKAAKKYKELKGLRLSIKKDSK